MEAKDTVIKPDETLLTGQRLLEAQAEITAPIFFEEGRKAGRKEVVEWILRHRKSPSNDYTHYFWDFTLNELEAKLKEWGLKVD